MMNGLSAMLLAASFDAAAALEHARALAALGPHPMGSPRAEPAAQYVAEQLREAGLAEVRLHRFQSDETAGINAIGILRGSSRELILVGAHHDTVPGSPGAFDDASGVGVVIEAARASVQRSSRPRTLVFVSFDGEEVGALGSRAYVEDLGAEARSLVAAVIVEACGWASGTPVVQISAYADPLRPGRTVTAPSWLIRAALSGASRGEGPAAVGDPLLGWLQQPAARTFRMPHYRDDLSFLQARLPALSLSDSAFAAQYPWYHQPADTADKLDPTALGRMGRAVLGVVEALEGLPSRPVPAARSRSDREQGGAPGFTPGAPEDPEWFAAFGQVVEERALLIAGAATVVPGLVAALATRGLALPVRLLQAALFGLLLWRRPVPALWVFGPLNLLSVLPRRWWALLLACAPALCLTVFTIAAWRKGFVAGTWLQPWEVAAAGLTLVISWIRPPVPVSNRRRRSS